MILTVIVFLIILSILVLVHEFGHFVVGRLNKIKVEEFALGLPFTKPLWSKKLKDGMKLSLYPVLFGGFVKLLGEEKEEVAKNAFGQKSVWQRIAVVTAGVTMNLFLAIVAFYVFLASANFQVLLPKFADYNFKSPNQTLIAVTATQKDSPAEKSGLQAGDIFVETNGQKFTTLRDFQNYVKSMAGQEIVFSMTDPTLTASKTVTIIPRQNPPPGEGALGVGIAEAVKLTYETPAQKAVSGLAYTADMFVYNIKVLGAFASQAITSRDVAPLSESVSGPVGIASAVGTILDLGGTQALSQLINLLGLLSLSLAFMNILPFPALDGGRLAFLLVEAFTKKKLAAKYENWINQAGMAILLGFIVLVSFNDLIKIFVR